LGQFSYKAVDRGGAHVAGIVDAADRRSAVAALAGRGLERRLRHCAGGLQADSRHIIIKKGASPENRAQIFTNIFIASCGFFKNSKTCILYARAVP